MDEVFDNKLVGVKIQLLEGGKLPEQATEEAAGMDLFACINSQGSVAIENIKQDYFFLQLVGEDGEHVAPDSYEIIMPGATKVISAGFRVELPKGYEMQVRPRSGNSLKTSLRIANSPGTIDSDYRGNVGVIIENTGKDPVVIFDGDKIAQAVIQEVPSVVLQLVNDLSETVRGTGGFGSTDKK